MGSGWKTVLLSDLPGEEHSPSQGVPVGSSSRVGRGGDWGPVGSAGRFGPREPPTHARGEQGRATQPGGQGSERNERVSGQCRHSAHKFSYPLPGIRDIDETG